MTPDDLPSLPRSSARTRRTEPGHHVQPMETALPASMADAASLANPAASAPRRQRQLRPQVQEHTFGHDLRGALLILGGVLLFLALFSFDAHDLPAWALGNPMDKMNMQPANFIGKTGAVISFYLFMVVGMATYTLPFTMIWFGVCKMASRIKITARHNSGLALMVITGAAILDLSGWKLGDPTSVPFGIGGAIGSVVGGKAAMNLFGPVGSLIVLGLLYLLGLVFVTGLHPAQVVASAREHLPGLCRTGWNKFWTWVRTPRTVTPEPVPEVTATTTEEGKPRRRRSTSPSTSSVGSSTATEPPVADILSEPAEQLALPLEPDIKIIDASAPKLPDPADAKPALADVWAKKRAAKIEQTGPAPFGSLTERYKDYQLPALDLLNWPDPALLQPADPEELRQTQDTIVHALNSFGITVTKGDITRGPAITRYEVRPVDGLRVSRIAQLDADLARATKAERINILAPIPGKDTVGIEIANKTKVVVPIRELLEDEVFSNGKAKLPLALGKDVYGKTIIADLAAMPHLLVAGATGSGKSVCINSIITSLVCRFAPDELRFIMIDPKVVEMQTYAELPHLALPVVVDPKKALLALRWVVKEMETRYQIFAQEGCRNFETFNNRNRKKSAVSRTNGQPNNGVQTKSGPSLATTPSLVPPPLPDEMPTTALTPENLAKIGEVEMTTGTSTESLIDQNGDWAGDSQPPSRPHRSQALVIPDSMPYMVVIIDELADLMQTASADIEVAIARITQMARAAGIHLIVATQTPRADVITGVIKANVPSRIAFQVASALDSRVILDRKGAENLVGKGDMLYLPPGTANLVRSQGALVTDDEIHALVAHCTTQGKPVFDNGNESLGGPSTSNFDDDEDGEEELDSEDERTLEKCLEVIRQEKKASTSLLQRRLGLGYGRAARMIDLLEDRGIIGPGEGAKPREILVRMD